MTACITNRCRQGRSKCPTPYLCTPLQTATDSGHKVAHGKNTDYFGKAAEGNPGFPFELVEPVEPTKEISFWQWLQDLIYTAAYIGGSIVLGAIVLAVLVWVTGLHRVLF